MDTPTLPDDFKEFLKLLNSNEVHYLLIGGWAVGYYGYVRSTVDMDVWIAVDQANARKTVHALREFGFGDPNLTEDLLLQPKKIVRMGVPPFRIEVLTTISGVAFDDCYARRGQIVFDGVDVNIIALEDLKLNKQSTGRGKDLVDLVHLP